MKSVKCMETLLFMMESSLLDEFEKENQRCNRKDMLQNEYEDQEEIEEDENIDQDTVINDEIEEEYESYSNWNSENYVLLDGQIEQDNIFSDLETLYCVR